VYQEIEPDPQGGLGLLFAKTKVQADTGLDYYCYQTYAPTAGTLDLALNPNGHVLTSQLPPTFKNLFHCGMAGTLATPNSMLNPAQNYVDFFNSISYGINFDVKLANGTPYTCVATTATNYPALANPPGSDSPPYTAIQDMNPDPCYIADMKNPGAFILISEAYTGEGPPIRPNPVPPYWTGGRIAMQATEDLSSNLYHPAPIVGRHDGRANVLYGDLHVASEQAVSGGTQTININLNTPLWTLPGD
jgi:prepilin-type processing-associated H-X9-DG protein